MRHENIEVCFVLLELNLHYLAKLEVKVIQKLLHLWTLDKKREPLVTIDLQLVWMWLCVLIKMSRCIHCYQLHHILPYQLFVLVIILTKNKFLLKLVNSPSLLIAVEKLVIVKIELSRKESFGIWIQVIYYSVIESSLLWYSLIALILVKQVFDLFFLLYFCNSLCLFVKLSNHRIFWIELKILVNHWR